MIGRTNAGGKPEEEKTVTAGTSAVEVTPSTGKTMKKVTVKPTPSQSKEVTPTTSKQTVVPDSGKLLSSVVVNGLIIPTGISITSAPSKTAYKAGETINLSGMVVKVDYSDGTSADITSECTYSPSAGKTVYESTNAITVSWVWNDITYTVLQAITVTRVLSSISITTQPTKKSYTAGDTLDLSGMVVRATFNSGATANVTGYTCSPTTLSTVGTQTITVSYTENGVTKTTTFTVSVSVKTVSFSSGTWAEIHDMIHAAISGSLTLSDHWVVGDTKSVTLTTNEVIELQIAGFNHDTYSDGVTAPVTLVMKNCLKSTYYMNSSSTNSGGYPASAMKTYVENNIYAKLPSDLKAIVSAVKKKCYTSYSSTSSLSEADYNVFLLSEMEVFGSKSYGVGTGEGSKYAIFTDATSRVKKVNGSANSWWLRSVRSGDSNDFCRVNSDGTANYSYAGSNRGVAVGLCIR